MTMPSRAANVRDTGPQVFPTTSLRVRKWYLLLAIGWKIHSDARYMEYVSYNRHRTSIIDYFDLPFGAVATILDNAYPSFSINVRFRALKQIAFGIYMKCMYVEDSSFML